MAKIHLPLNKTDETNIYRPFNKMDNNCYMVTFQIRTFGRNICNSLAPFIEIVYIVLFIPAITENIA